MRAPYFRFFVDDFLGGVGDMTQSEIGAYILLLCHQWNKGMIPSDKSRISVITKGEVTDHVLAKFKDGKNPRLELIRIETETYITAQSEHGKAGMAKRWAGRDRQPIQELSGFDRFWSAYPKKVAKADAEKAWRKVDVKLIVVLAALEHQKKSKDWTKDGGKFIPHPASWLNSRRWEDEVINHHHADFIPDATFDSTKS